MGETQLSGVLNMSGDYSAIRRTVAALSAQTRRQQIELIIIATAAHVPSIDREALSVFGAYQVIEVDSLPSGAYGWAEGFRRARSPIVVICEDHSFPAPNWAQTLIDAHQEHPAALAICPAMHNGNPQTLTSWANFTLSFGEWFAPASEKPREVMSAAGHNTSYKREPLMATYGGELDRWLNPERVLHSDLIARHKQIMLDPRTHTAHVNLSLPGAYFGVSFAGGRVFGAARAAGWPLPRKLIYAALFPLVPLVRLRRMLQQLNTPEKRREARFFPAMPMILAGLGCHAFGEAVGYLTGVGNTAETYTGYELRRQEHIRQSERREIFGLKA